MFGEEQKVDDCGDAGGYGVGYADVVSLGALMAAVALPYVLVFPRFRLPIMQRL